MRTPLRLLLMVLTTIALTGCDRDADDAGVVGSDIPPPAPVSVRVASYNVSLYDQAAGGVIRRLEADDAHAHAVAAVIRHLRPDLVLLNEFDYDAGGRAADLFQRGYLESESPDSAPLHYPHRYLGPVNTGEPSGLDLDGDGRSDSANDAWGYGHHPGQYGMLVLSRYPIDQARVRSFQKLRWSTMPGARRPLDPDSGQPFHADAVWSSLRLSSKSHWDVPIETPFGTLHFLVSHPTPPVFDGTEDRNGLRNHDEIRLWAEYLSDGERPWLCDDDGRCGGLAGGAHFVIAGDQNADPQDGDGVPGAIAQLLQHPRVDASFVPRAPGGAARALQHGIARRGDAQAHTGDFGPRAGTLRLDYVLPANTLQVLDGGIFWPVSPPAHVQWAAASDHHLVWLDLAVAASSRSGTSP